MSLWTSPSCSEIGRAAGVVTDDRWEKHTSIERELTRARDILNDLVLSPQVSSHWDILVKGGTSFKNSSL